MSSEKPVVPFSLSQYEETKQRMKQLQLEQQQQKKAAAAAAASLQPAPVQESKESISSSSKSRLDRVPSATSRETSKLPSSSPSAASSARAQSITNPTSSPSSSSINTKPTTTSFTRATSARAARPSATNNVIASTPTSAASGTPTSTRSNVTTPAGAPASSYSPLSPRSVNGWTADRTATSTQQLALGLNQGLSSPRRPLDGTTNSNSGLGTTAPFAVTNASNVTPASSLPSSPKAILSPRHSQLATAIGTTSTAAASSSDPFQPIVVALPSAPDFTLYNSSERETFQSKLDALSNALLTTAQNLGLKYSLDTRLKLLIHELDSAHTASLKQASDEVSRMKKSSLEAEARMKEVKERYDLELTRLKLSLTERQRKMDRLQTQAIAKATKDMEATLRAEYAEKNRKFEGVEKYNQEKLRQLEDQVRVQIKAQLQAENKQTKQAELNLQAKLDQLEREGMELIQAKDNEIEECKKRQLASDQRLKDLSAREKTWERKYEKSLQGQKSTLEENNLLKVELAREKQENLSLLHRLDKMKEERGEIEREANQQTSHLSNQLMDYIKSIDDLKSERDQLQLQFQRMEEQTTQTMAQLKSKHVNELDTIQSRITSVLQKKDDQIRELKSQLKSQMEKVKEIERELGGL